MTAPHTPGRSDGTGPSDHTRVVRAGLPPAEPYQPSLPGPVFAAHYHLPGDPGSAPYDYGRHANPTWTALESAIAELESPDGPAEVVAFASGMGAAASVLLGLVRTGDAVVLPEDGYHGTSGLSRWLTGYGVEVRAVPSGGREQFDALDGARLLWLESPTNPGLDVCDIPALAAAAHERGALLAVDNTLATPVGQRPLELGADLAVSSGTKALSGHGDVLLGYVACRDGALAEGVRAWRKLVGAIPGPMEAWLAHRSLPTLGLRVARQAENALAVAEALRTRPEVTGLRHPGLPEDPGHELAARQMRHFGCVVSYTLPDRAFAERYLSALRLVDEATSFGGVRSTAERRARWGGNALPEGFIRMSCGVEDSADLVADVHRALDAAAAGA